MNHAIYIELQHLTFADSELESLADKVIHYKNGNKYYFERFSDLSAFEKLLLDMHIPYGITHSL